MKIGNGLLLAIGMGITSFGLAQLAFADTAYCNGRVTYFQNGWSFGCYGDCAGVADCEITRIPFEGGYWDICTCDTNMPICCHCEGQVFEWPGVPSTIVPIATGHCNPPIEECPAGSCGASASGGGSAWTAECQ